MQAEDWDYADKNEVYESQDNLSVAIREQIQEYNNLEDVLRSGATAFEYANVEEVKTEADSDKAQQEELFENSRNISSREQGGLSSLPRANSREDDEGVEVLCGDDADTLPSSSSPSYATCSSSTSSSSHKPEGNLAKGKCITCDDEYVSVFELACGHTICPKCTAELFELAIRDTSLMPPKCCQIEIDPNLALEQLELPHALEFVQSHMEATATNKMYCPNSNCSQFINLDFLEADSGYELDCPTCKTTMCTKCQQSGHTGISCDVAKKRSSDLDMAFLNLAGSKNWRKCRKCGRMIELTYGCKHMTCRCKHEFCFTCGADWKPTRGCKCALFTEESVVQRGRERHMVQHVRERHPVQHVRERQHPENQHDECAQVIILVLFFIIYVVAKRLMGYDWFAALGEYDDWDDYDYDYDYD